MAQYTCGNRGQCGFANGGRRFTWSDSTPPVCPGCGRGEYISLASDAGMASLGIKWIASCLEGGYERH